MKFKKIDLRSNTLFHYTTLQNAKKIIEEGKIRTGNDVFCFFTESEEKSRELFFELMEQGAEYIGDDLTVHKRQYCNPQENVILKITAKDDDRFYRFICDADGFNPYDYSMLHLGELNFEEVEILPIVQKEAEQIVSYVNTGVKALHKKSPFKNGLKRIAAAGAVAAIFTMNTFSVFATSTGSWLDSGKYDIRWYDSASSYNITTAAQLAGISYLANNGETFDSKTFKIENNIDLTEYEWVTIPKSFSGVIEGAHKVLIRTYQTPFVEDLNDISGVEISYSVPVSGIEDGKIYCSAVDVTWYVDSIDKVMINGTEVPVMAGKFKVAPANGTQTIVVTDKADKEVRSYTITVNDGHTWGDATYEWAADNSTCTATRFCTINDCDGKETETVDSTSTVTQEQTCILPELTTYTATFTNAAFAMQTKENVLTAKAAGHSFDSELDSTCNDCSYTRDVSNPSTGVDTPETGDSSYMVPWIALLFISGASIVAIFTKKKRETR